MAPRLNAAKAIATAAATFASIDSFMCSGLDCSGEFSPAAAEIEISHVVDQKHVVALRRTS
jgi:hypothetical protein